LHSHNHTSLTISRPNDFFASEATTTPTLTKASVVFFANSLSFRKWLKPGNHSPYKDQRNLPEKQKDRG
ncbi:unnamed protein product, partial [Ilex paraguariensis]